MVHPILSDRCLSLSCLSCPVCNVGVLWPNGWSDEDETWQCRYASSLAILCQMGMIQLPSRKKGAEPPIFGPCLLWPNGCMDWEKLGMEVGLNPGHIVLDGTKLPFPKKGGTGPIFGPCLLWPNGCMHQDATWFGGRPRPRPHCVLDGDQASLPQKNKRGHSPPPTSFHSMSVVAKRSPISATAEHLWCLEVKGEGQQALQSLDRKWTRLLTF